MYLPEGSFAWDSLSVKRCLQGIRWVAERAQQVQRRHATGSNSISYMLRASRGGWANECGGASPAAGIRLASEEGQIRYQMIELLLLVLLLLCVAQTTDNRHAADSPTANAGNKAT